MDKEKYQAMLMDALEEEIPSSQIDLWPAVRDNLVAGTQIQNQQGKKMNKSHSNHLPRLAIAVILIGILLAAGFLTPQGRSFAQSVLQLFTRTESTSFQPENVPGSPAESDPAAPTAEPQAPLISVAEAEAQLGFEIAELPEVPRGFEYLGTRVYNNAVYLEYQASGHGSNLIIQQSQTGFNQSDWEQVPEDAVVPVRIGDLDGEFVQGTFVVLAGESSATWNPDMAMLRLRWMDDGISYEISKTGDVESVEYLDMGGLVKLAESLAINP